MKGAALHFDIQKAMKGAALHFDIQKVKGVIRTFVNGVTLRINSSKCDSDLFSS